MEVERTGWRESATRSKYEDDVGGGGSCQGLDVKRREEGRSRELRQGTSAGSSMILMGSGRPRKGEGAGAQP